MRQYPVMYDLEGNRLSGKLYYLDESFDIFTLQEIEGMLQNHLYVMNGKFGNQLIEKEPIEVLAIHELGIESGTGSFQVEIKPFDIKADTRMFLDTPELKRRIGVGFDRSEDRLIYTADVSKVPADSLLCVFASGMAAGAGWRCLIATVRQGSTVRVGHPAEIEIDNDRMTIKLPRPLMGTRNHISSCIWSRKGTLE